MTTDRTIPQVVATNLFAVSAIKAAASMCAVGLVLVAFVNRQRFGRFLGRSDLGLLAHPAGYVSLLDIADQRMHDGAGGNYKRNHTKKRVIFGVPVK